VPETQKKIITIGEKAGGRGAHYGGKVQRGTKKPRSGSKSSIDVTRNLCSTRGQTNRKKKKEIGEKRKQKKKVQKEGPIQKSVQVWKPSLDK